MAQPNYAAPAVERALNILEMMAKNNHSFSVSEMATLLDVSSNSVFRIFKEFERKGYVIKNPSDAKYSLTEKLYYLGNLLQERASFRELAQPSMARLGEFTKETILLSQLGDGYSTIVTAQIPSTQPIKFLSSIGARYDSYNSALGKAMLSACSVTEQKAYITNTNFTVQRNNGIESSAAFADELQKIAKTGIAFDAEESVPGLYGLACPVLGAGGQLVGAMGISGISFRMTKEKINDYILVLKQEVQTVSQLLGYTA